MGWTKVNVGYGVSVGYGVGGAAFSGTTGGGGSVGMGVAVGTAVGKVHASEMSTNTARGVKPRIDLEDRFFMRISGEGLCFS